MPKTYTISAEDANEIRKAMKDKNNSRFYAKLQSVALRGEGKDNDEIGSITGYHPSYVSHLVSVFCNQGLAALCKDGRKGGNNRKMNQEEADKFLETFDKQAQEGQVITVEEIAIAYDKITGKVRKSRSSVYYFLHKQNWRKVMPRGQHPKKASEAEIEASKKLTIPT